MEGESKSPVITLYDDMIFYWQNGGEEEYVKKLDVRKTKEQLKLDMFIQRVIVYDKTNHDEDMLNLVCVFENIGTRLGIQEQSEVVQLIIKRDPKAVQIIKSQTYLDLGLEEERDEEEVHDETAFLTGQLQGLIDLSNKEKENIGKPTGDEGRLYSLTNLYRIVAMLDFFFGLAECSPRALNLVQSVSLPHHLQYLIELSVEGMPQIQIVVQKLFQSMMRLDLPSEVYEEAVTLAKSRNVETSALGFVENEVNRVLA